MTANSDHSQPTYLGGLTKCAFTLTTQDGKSVDVWELSVPSDEQLLTDWAVGFRRNYCSDQDIDLLRNGTGLTRSEYLTQLVFPDSSNAPGPAVRSGDFAELLVSDYVNYLLGYWVPRSKYADKASRNESVKGVDILGFRMVAESQSSSADTLLSYEVKAQLSGGPYLAKLQSAIDHSSKDYLRRAETLNATKRRLIQAGEVEKSLVVQRFQNITDHPYVYKSGAAAVLSDSAYDEALISGATTCVAHNNCENIELLVIRGSGLMALVNGLYQRASDAA